MRLIDLILLVLDDYYVCIINITDKRTKFAFNFKQKEKYEKIIARCINIDNTLL